MLHLAGYDLPMGELKRFRQWDSRTPGHPEFRLTDGVECQRGHWVQGSAMGRDTLRKDARCRFNDQDFL